MNDERFPRVFRVSSALTSAECDVKNPQDPREAGACLDAGGSRRRRRRRRRLGGDDGRQLRHSNLSAFIKRGPLGTDRCPARAPAARHATLSSKRYFPKVCLSFRVFFYRPFFSKDALSEHLSSKSTLDEASVRSKECIT